MVAAGIARLKTHKATGSLFVSAELLRALGGEPLYNALAELFTYVGMSGVPTNWNKLLLSSLYKNKGDRA